MMGNLLARLLDLALPLFPGDGDLRRSLRQPRYGYRHRVVGLTTLNLGELRVRKEPTLIALPGKDPESRYWTPARVLTNPVDRFFPLVHGREDRRLHHLPHLKVLSHHDLTGELPVDSDYSQLQRVRAALQGRTLDLEELQARMWRLVRVCASIHRAGYLGPGHRRQRVVVMERSVHPPTATYSPEGYEVFDGHHRAVALAHLGHDRLEVLMTRAEKVGEFPWEAEPPDPWPWDGGRPRRSGG